VGTVSPSDLLELSGSTAQPAIRLNDTDVSGLYHRIFTPTNTGLAISADTGNVASDSFLRFDVDGSERARIDSSGRVMVGTTTEGAANEAEELTIAGTGGVGMTIRSTDSGTSRIYFSDGTSGTSEYAGYQIYNHSSNAMIFGTNAIERMRIDSSGNVGIGASPTQKLQVSGAGSQYVSVISTDSGNTGVLFGDATKVDEGYVLYANSDNSLRFGSNGSERMRIKSTGKIGLGTTSADAELHIEPVSGGANASILLSNDGRTQYFRIQNNETDDALTFNANDTNERMRIDSSGNVGIGESNPVAKTHIQGSGTSGQTTASLILENSSSGTAGVDITGSAGSSRLRFLYGGGPSTGTNALTEAMNIGLEGSNAGNVGIGTSSPSNKLEVHSGDGTNVVAKSTNGNGGYLNYSGLSSGGTTTFSVTHNGRVFAEDGIQFDSSGEVLDSYEEGTWTPSLVGLSNTPSFHNNTGKYTKVGRVCTVQFFQQTNVSPTFSSGTAEFQVGGLPFSVYGSGYTGSQGSVNAQAFNYHGSNNTQSTVGSGTNGGAYLSASVNASEQMYFQVTSSGATRGIVNNNGAAQGYIIEATVTYFTLD
jgi:hypothetical protein